MHKHITTLIANKLCMVDLWRFFHNLHQVCQAVNLGLAEFLLQQPKTPIRQKLGMAHNEEGNGNGLIEANKNSRRKVLHHIPVVVE